MANPHRGEISLKALGKEWTLRLTTNSICELEDHLGEPFNDIIAGLQNKPGVRVLRGLLWAGVLDSIPGFDVKTAGAIIDDIGMPLAVEKILAALGVSLAVDDPKGEGGHP